MMISGYVYVAVSVFLAVFSVFIINRGDLEYSKFGLFFLASGVFFIMGLVKIIAAQVKKPEKHKQVILPQHRKPVHNQRQHPNIKHCPNCGNVQPAGSHYCLKCHYRFY